MLTSTLSSPTQRPTKPFRKAADRLAVFLVAGSLGVLPTAASGTSDAGGSGERGDDSIVAVPFDSVPEGTTLIGGPSPITLGSDVSVTGTVTSQGTYQPAGGAPTTYEISTERYVVDAGPAQVGVVVPLDQNRLTALCRDLDGCGLLLVMINWDGNETAASRQHRLFLSEVNASWRSDDFYEGANYADGLDNDDSTGIQLSFYDCAFTDGESSTGENSVLDGNPGFGLLNLAGDFEDSTTVCRIVFID